MKLFIGYREACGFAYAKGGEDGVRRFLDNPLPTAEAMAGPYGRVLYASARGLKVIEMVVPDDPSWML